MSPKPLVSIIIRTKNEERWITPCFEALFSQSYQDFEIVVVDNKSTDKTLDKIRQFPVDKIIRISDYLPGKALNLGIEKAVGHYIVCLSAHCIPVNSEWLETLMKTLDGGEQYAGVYGRQEPMSFTPSADRRDLMLVFGLDRKIQRKDSFFHNANSIIRRTCWEKVHFDQEITNIEDRIWAQEMLNLGYQIIYEPEASVYHYHGIHQDRNEERMLNVARIIESQPGHSKSGQIDANRLKIAAIIPVRGETMMLGDKHQVCYTIEAALKSRYIDRVIVSTDSEVTIEIARRSGAECPFIRPPEFSLAHINLQAVQKFSLEQLEQEAYFPDLVVHLEETYPFRQAGLLDGMILHLLAEGYDSVIAARPETGWIWRETPDNGFQRLDSGDVPREFKEKTLLGLHGLGCVTHPEFIRNENMTGFRTGLYTVEHPLAGFEVRDSISHKISVALMKIYKKTNNV
jgi:GT2 family glycosyltransferase